MKSDSKVVLSKRLQVIADNIKSNSVVADIGCDHAFLSIAIAQAKNPKMVYACDINEKPLQSAQQNIEKYGVMQQVQTVLSDGFDNLQTPEKIDTVIIAGMGGELIADIIKRAGWLKDSGVTLFLQPMTTHNKLRGFLVHEGFVILKEFPVVENQKVYTVMKAVFSGEIAEKENFYYYVGEIATQYTEEAMVYKKNVLQKLERKRNGLKQAKEQKNTKDLERLTEKIKETLK